MLGARALPVLRTKPSRNAAGESYGWLRPPYFNNPFNPWTYTVAGRHAAAACEVFERTTRRYKKPDVPAGHHPRRRRDRDGERGDCLAATLLSPHPLPARYRAEPRGADPRILLVSPMSGHFATLLRGTVETLLPDHEVYIIDWQDARDVSLTEGTFDLDDYILYLREMLRVLGGDVHMLAICQSAVPALAAVALMEEDGDANRPGKPHPGRRTVDTRISPTVVNRLAERRGTEWFRKNVITTCALAQCRSRACGVSRLPSAFWVHVNESRPTCSGA